MLTLSRSPESRWDLGLKWTSFLVSGFKTEEASWKSETSSQTQKGSPVLFKNSGLMSRKENAQIRWKSNIQYSTCFILRVLLTVSEAEVKSQWGGKTNIGITFFSQRFFPQRTGTINIHKISLKPVRRIYLSMGWSEFQWESAIVVW